MISSIRRILFLPVLVYLSGSKPVDLDVTRLEDDMPVVLVNMISRHGSRAPGETYPKDPLQSNFSLLWPEGMYQLTNKGKMEQYELGAWLRRRYDKLLGDEYSTDYLHVLSTDKDRTIMSAQCNLAALYPPKDRQIWNPDLLWQPIPVHAYDETAGGLLNLNDKIDCPRYWKVYRLMEQTSKYIKLHESHKQLIEYLHENTGKEFETYMDLEHLYAYIKYQVDENLEIPDWAQPIYPEPWFSAAVNYFVLPTYNDQLKRLFMGPLLKNIIEEFDNKVSGRIDRRMTLYFGHEDNISNLLNVLGSFNWMIPPYSSAVLIELRRDKSNQYFVTISYKNSTDEPYLLQIQGCQAVCPLAKFKSIISPYIPNNWTDECRQDYTNSASLMTGVADLLSMIVFTYFYINLV